ncbi:MAG: nucleotidyltransferase domain-containing protein [Pseudomonadota bacterium]|nr:nucleotidyltransferase domain-containing protein [Pseudomonadota bacterium]
MSTEFGLAAATVRDLRAVFDATPGLRRVQIFGSRATGTAGVASDIDLALDAPGWTTPELGTVLQRLEALLLVHKLDVVHWQAVTDPTFVAEIERDRREFWAPLQRAADVEAVGGRTL